MSFRPGRFAAMQWRASKRAYGRHIGKYRRVVLVGLLVLGAVGLVLVFLPARYGERMPGPSAPRPVLTPAPSSEPAAGAPEKPAQPPRRAQAALRPPPRRARPRPAG